MKYFRIIIPLLLVCLLFSGCNFKISTSIDELISPLSPFGDNADVKNALDSYAKGGYTLKIPTGGNYITSYSFYDLDGDGQEEAFAFYERNDKLGTTELALIRKTEDSWQVVQSLKGVGREVYSLDFVDLNGDGGAEVLVCWDAISKSTNHELSIYRISEDKNQLTQIGETKTINSYVSVDMVNGGENELLLFEVNSGNSGSAVAELYTMHYNAFGLIGSTKLDSHITSYNKISVESYNGGKRVYADAIKSDGASMLTEILIWSPTYETIISPFYSYPTGLTSDTTRKAMLYCMDIDDNELIDVPTDYLIAGLPDEVEAVNWCEYINSVLVHRAYSLFAKNDGYILILPNDVINRVRIKYNRDNKEMRVMNKETKKDICTIMPVLKATYSSQKYPDYITILESSGYVYLARQGDDTDIVIPGKDLKQLIKAVN